MFRNSLIESYNQQEGVWDEMVHGTGGIRSPYENFFSSIGNLQVSEMTQKDEMAKKLFMSQGITFTVYSSGEGIEKIFPFDIVPRIITSDEWRLIESGLKQRLKALNIFLKDIYHKQFILQDGVIPPQLIYSCPNFLREMINVDVPFDIYTHISGVDLIRDNDGEFYVLEDNLRTPSGVSYMLENRSITYRIFPDMIPKNNVRTVKEYPDLLYKNLMALANRQISDPTVVLLTPGIYNSAYFEHSTLARLMGIELVEGRDLIVNNNYVFMKTTKGLQQVDVIYRRVDDEYIDPLVFRPDSILGVPGIYWAYRKGNVAIVNSMGNGVADDKAIYVYVPEMIKYYLNEEPILKNVPTFRLAEEDSRKHVFENMDKMVIKRTNESGGYGMLMGNTASDEEINNFKEAIQAEPRNFIASLSLAFHQLHVILTGNCNRAGLISGLLHCMAPRVLT